MTIALLERDKLLSQHRAADCGFVAPAALAIGPYSSLESLADMEYPIVIKPRLEGSSIGIYEDSKAESFEDARNLVRRLSTIGIHELVAQAFVPGKEAHIPVIGNHSAIDALDVCETFVPDEEDYFDTKLFHANIKNRTPYRWDVRTITPDVMSTELRECTKRYFLAMGAPNVMRIDGKLVDGRFHFIEVNSFPDIGRKSVAARAYQFRGRTYEEFLSAIIDSVVTDS